MIGSSHPSVTEVRTSVLFMCYSEVVTSVIIELIFSVSVLRVSVQCISSVYKVRFRCLSLYCVVVSILGIFQV